MARSPVNARMPTCQSDDIDLSDCRVQVSIAATMLYYDPHNFYTLIFALRGSVLPLCVPHALFFAAVGALAAWLVERGILTHDFNEISLLCGLVISLLFTFRLNFSFARYDEAINAVSAIQGDCRRITARLCAYLPSDPADAQSPATSHSADLEASVFRVRRWLILIFLLCKARVRADDANLDFALLKSIGLITEAECELLERPVTSSKPEEEGRLRGRVDTFPSKARVTLVCQLIWSDLSLHLRSGAFHAQQFNALDNEVSALGKSFGQLDRLMSQLLPFAFANMAKSVLLVYSLSFPFGVAAELRWATPAVSFAQALLFLSMDKVGSVMDTPFAHDEYFGLDLEKRVRRTDKETAALVGVWLGRPCFHFDLYPDHAKSSLPKRYHEDNVRGGGGLGRGARRKCAHEGRGAAADVSVRRPHVVSMAPSTTGSGSRLARQATNGSALRKCISAAASRQATQADVLDATGFLASPLLAGAAAGASEMAR